ncbi:Protein of unknown function [Sphingomonas palmae]|uniref:DUF3168 domain-containing protein n=1 Tax=Sphingomonas palmae TaxID=1855283 RepID=A0A1H7MQQ2_9SPHN|nr:DUF3168 domain-containing protein [Sphingomonas palmae]SEL13620.1 Protein of unknown function [Sphingomonas palmae]
MGEGVSAAAAVRAGVLARLRGVGGVNGVWEGAGVSAAAPFVLLGDVVASDWSTKDAAGRELRVAVTVRDRGDSPVRAGELAAAVEAAVAGLPRALDGWRVASVVLLRSSVVASGKGAWAAMVNHRVRVLAE